MNKLIWVVLCSFLFYTCLFDQPSTERILEIESSTLQEMDFDSISFVAIKDTDTTTLKSWQNGTSMPTQLVIPSHITPPYQLITLGYKDSLIQVWQNQISGKNPDSLLMGKNITDSLFPIPLPSKWEYHLTLGSNPSLGGYVQGPSKLEWNKETAIEAIPAEGYDFVRWENDSASTAKFKNNDSTLATTTIQANKEASLRAVFSLKTYRLTLSQNISGGSTVADSQWIHGLPQTISAIASNTARFLHWKTMHGKVTLSDSTSDTTELTLFSNAEIQAIYSQKPILKGIKPSESTSRFNTAFKLTFNFKDTLSDSFPKTKIFYTDDGSTPTVSSKLYQGYIDISRTTTIKVITSNEPDFLPSEPISLTYTLNEKPKITLDSQFHTNDTVVLYGQYTFSGKATDDAGIDSLWVITPTGNYPLKGDSVFSHSESTKTTQVHLIQVFAKDSDGLLDTLKFYAVYVPVLAKPEVNIDSIYTSELFLSWKSVPHASSYQINHLGSVNPLSEEIFTPQIRIGRSSLKQNFSVRAIFQTEDFKYFSPESTVITAQFPNTYTFTIPSSGIDTGFTLVTLNDSILYLGGYQVVDSLWTKKIYRFNYLTQGIEEISNKPTPLNLHHNFANVAALHDSGQVFFPGVFNPSGSTQGLYPLIEKISQGGSKITTFEYRLTPMSHYFSDISFDSTSNTFFVGGIRISQIGIPHPFFASVDESGEIMTTYYDSISKFYGSSPPRIAHCGVNYIASTQAGNCKLTQASPNFISSSYLDIPGTNCFTERLKCHNSTNLFHLYTTGAPGNRNSLLVYRNGLSEIWKVEFNTSADERILDVKFKNNQVFAFGENNGRLWLTRLDMNGKVLWQKFYKSNIQAQSFDIIQDGIMMLGITGGKSTLVKADFKGQSF